MDEDQGSAAFYQKHKDDPDVWEDPEPATPAESRKGLSISITVRFPAEEAGLIRRFAEDQGITYSDVVRKAVSQYIRPTFDLKVTDMSGNLFYTLGPGPTQGSPTIIKIVAPGPAPGSFTAPSGGPRQDRDRA